jgi:hypothetical protein
VLRLQLYHLKDTLYDLSSAAREASWTISGSAQTDLTAFSKIVDQLRDGLSIYLSNNHSRWLDTMRAGGLSYSEFKRLDIGDMLAEQAALAPWVTNFESAVRTYKWERSKEYIEKKFREQEENSERLSKVKSESEKTDHFDDERHSNDPEEDEVEDEKLEDNPTTNDIYGSLLALLMEGLDAKLIQLAELRAKLNIPDGGLKYEPPKEGPSAGAVV